MQGGSGCAVLGNDAINLFEPSLSAGVFQDHAVGHNILDCRRKCKEQRTVESTGNGGNHEPETCQADSGL